MNTTTDREGNEYNSLNEYHDRMMNAERSTDCDGKQLVAGERCRISHNGLTMTFMYVNKHDQLVMKAGNGQECVYHRSHVKGLD